MKSSRTIIETFLGPVESCERIYTDAGEAYITPLEFYRVKAERAHVYGEICLLSSYNDIVDPLFEGAEYTHLRDVENLSGRLVAGVFTDKGKIVKNCVNERCVLIDKDGKQHCLYLLET